jgi:hypothetical protein
MANSAAQGQQVFYKRERIIEKRNLTDEIKHLVSSKTHLDLDPQILRHAPGDPGGAALQHFIRLAFFR